MHVWRMNARWALDRKTNVRHSLHRLTLRSLTEPASSMVNPACIKNTSIAVLFTDFATTTVEDMAMRACGKNFNQFCCSNALYFFLRHTREPLLSLTECSTPPPATLLGHARGLPSTTERRRQMCARMHVCRARE